MTDCLNCSGEGWYIPGDTDDNVTCEECGGTGHLPDDDDEESNESPYALAVLPRRPPLPPTVRR